MRTKNLAWLTGFFLWVPVVSVAQVAPQQAHSSKVSTSVPSFAFEPLDNWKAAVLAGDKAALTSLYSASPAATAKTPQGQTQDPAEEPTFWSSLKAKGLDRLNIKVLEARTMQPGVIAIVLRVEGRFKGNGGEDTGIVAVHQMWVQKLGDWKVVSTSRGDIEAWQTRRLPEPAKPNTHLYAEPSEAPAEIASALAAASKDHKRVILIFGGNGCYDCHVLDTTFRSKEFAPLVNANYHVVHVNVGNYDANLDLAKKYDVAIDKGVPSLAILDPDGKLVVSQKKGEFESTVKIGPEDVVEFLKKWKPQHGG